FRDLDDRDVERAAAQVIDRDFAITFFLVEAKGQRGCGGLVDYAFYFKPRDAAGVFGRLTLRIVEVCRNRDHRFGDRFAEIVLGGLLHLDENLRGYFLRRDFLAAHLDPRVAIVRFDDVVGHQVDVLLDFLFFESPPD